MERILVIAPHADDEVIGCGGMIAKRSSEHKVDIVIMAMGNDDLQRDTTTRVKEMEVAHKELGVSRYAVLYWGKSGYMDRVPMMGIVATLDKILEDGQYDEVYYPMPCHMHDHTITYQACRAALRPGAHKMPRLVAEYEHNWPGWSSVEGGTMYVDISHGACLVRKLAAMSQFQSQLNRHREPHHPLSLDAIQRIASMRGLECGVEYAERYRVAFLRHD